MTIACCYVSPEGVVFGADSTTSYRMVDGLHYYNYAQKIFELGDGGTMAVMFWGLAGVGTVSFRTHLARLADDLDANKPASIQEAATRWAALIHASYLQAYAEDAEFQQAVDMARQLAAKPMHDKAHPDNPDARTAEEEDQLLALRLGLTIGSCLGGYVMPDRTPAAYFLHVEPHVLEAPVPAPIPVNSYRFWGAPNMLQRLLFAADDQTRQDILNSEHWTGTADQLKAIFDKNALQHVSLPLREVVDFVHTCVHSTIKALKFSHFQQICGGPVELAVISTDRKFRWVRHKEWDSAVVDGGRS